MYSRVHLLAMEFAMIEMIDSLAEFGFYLMLLILLGCWLTAKVRRGRL